MDKKTEIQGCMSRKLDCEFNSIELKILFNSEDEYDDDGST